MNARMHIAGSFQTMRQAIDEADKNFGQPGAEHHSQALQRLGRAFMNTIAEIIETDGGTDGYLYDADGIAQDIEAGYHKLIVQEEADELNHSPTQSGNGTLNHRQQGTGR